jgi:hypothetical protein
MTVYNYLNEKYQRTKFPYVGVREIKNKFGKEGLNELNELAKKNMVTKREGANFDLIEIIPENFVVK